ncbi:Glycosyl transferases group 1 [Caballeronia sp. SBC1]|uniref:glycosyltransferase n=1 Tax=Caballeronia sp. SBC1 TaxID=2705548 RepID=UPI00140D5585|nr:glycosyltransferase [Caballeronia sp. SBC1]QIN62864.1 Glycosyl transferases group 1 [Caballeronia sp. SBC1]
MKLLIFTPALKTSAIGRMTCLVSHALIAQGHQVVIVRAESDALLSRPSHDFGTRMIPWNAESQVLDAAAECDTTIYQVGDNYEYHEGCVTWLARLPGVVCLHDFFIGHMFHGWAQTNMDAANSILQHLYGDDVATRFFKYPDNHAFLEGTKDKAPLIEWIASQALGVITHSHWGTPRLKRSCAGPVRVVPLAYDAPGESLVSTDYQPNKFGRMKLLTIGHINRNKRVDNVIRAIAASPLLKQNVVYRLVGFIDPKTTLELTALANGLRVNLVISGPVNDTELASAVGEADVMSCLRWPSLEAASASAIEAMLYGKATVVTDTGFYSEIPDDCVEKISHEDEIDEVRATLERLYSSPAARAALGERASQWALSTHSADNYARELIDTSIASQKSRPRVNAKAYFVRVMKQWGASDELLCAEETVASLAVMD